MDNINDKIKEIADKLKGKKDDKNVELLNTETSFKKKRGGARPNSGPKPNKEKLAVKGIKQLIDDHINEEVEVVVTDKRSGTVIKMKKPRIVVMLEKLFQLGSKEGNVPAIKEWHDRALGKAPQTIKGSEEEPITLIVK